MSDTKEAPLVMSPLDTQYIYAARLLAVRETPWFGPLLRLLTIERNDEMTETMCVDRTGLVSFNLAFLRETVKEHGVHGLAFILLHESMHLLSRTFERRVFCVEDPNDEQQQQLFGVAADLSINSMLHKAFGESKSIKFPGTGVLPSMFKTPDGKPFPDGKTAEEYYGLLKLAYKNELPAQCTGKPGAGCDTKDSDGAGDKKGNQPGKKPRQVIGQAKIDATKREMANAVKQSSNGRGHSPFGAFLDVEEIPPPRVDWRQHLLHAAMVYTDMKSGMEDKTFMRRNVRQFDGIDDPILAGWCEYERSIVVIGDTSGSMHGDLAKLVSEVEEIAKLVGPVTFIACDAVVHAVETVHSAQDVAANLKGGGGTSMVPAFAVAKKRKPSLIICITDGAIGHTPKPDEIPVIWCLTQDYRHDVAQSEKDGWSTIVECW